ncbi:hypothetical protein KL86DYS2_13229 [uncultured Dysgonomonas sp.]|uniref:Uncharacterized protein n=1 Tax=uncultured Dysgonomonas sp. TaxID=206096 RepID=A0A212K7X7_9BACT|nr:hypothetical protein KL86DYS2_13229 [uncultured Dysgonomonas sp.]
MIANSNSKAQRKNILIFNIKINQITSILYLSLQKQKDDA